MRMLPLCALLLAASARADVPFQRTVLPNGLVVIFHEDHTLPHVAVNLWYHVGSKDEQPGHTGFAHLFEHLMFMGSKHVPYDLDKGAGLFDLIMEAQGGTNNATTAYDRTNYFEEGPSQLLETFLWLEADRMATLSQTLSQEKVDRQRRIVQNERRETVDNRPYGVAEESIDEEVFPPGHPYHHSVIGSHEDLERSTVDDVRRFFDTYYVPGNASLVVAGDFDTATARKLVERYFGWIRRPPPPPPPTAAPVHYTKQRERTFTDRVRLARTYLIYHAPADYADGSAECDVFARILGGSKSSRLNRKLRLEQQLAQSVVVTCESRKLAGLLMVEATALPGRTLESSEAGVDAEIDRLRKEPPAAIEVARAVAGIEQALAQGIEPLIERADQLNAYEEHFHDPGRFDWDRERYRKVTPDGVAELARQVLDPGDRVVIHVVPEEQK